MELINTWRRGAGTVDISDAVEVVCTDSDHPDTISALRDDVRSTAALLGRLVQQLHEERALSDGAVLKIIGSSFEKVE